MFYTIDLSKLKLCLKSFSEAVVRPVHYPVSSQTDWGLGIQMGCAEASAPVREKTDLRTDDCGIFM